MASVTFENIVKQYNRETVILKGINLDVRDGEFLVLVGPSGCGKSTLLRTLAGLETATSGTIRIGDKVVNDLEPKDRDIAMVFQSYALYPHMTVRENISFALKVRKFDKAEIDRRVEEVAKLLGITYLLDRLPKQMSGGQRQRVAMGRAIVRNPKVFLFDEPLSNLDASLRTQMRVELKNLHERLKTTIIYVTHDQVEAMTLADRIVVLNGGIIQQVGTPSELFDTPKNIFVAGFIGNPSMNFVTLDVENNDKNQILTAKGVRLEIEKRLDCAKVVLGVRPQDFELAGSGAEFTGHVEIVETLGRLSLVHVLVSEGVKITVEAQSAQVQGLKLGDSVGFNAKHDRIHFFDVATNERIVSEVK